MMMALLLGHKHRNIYMTLLPAPKEALKMLLKDFSHNWPQVLIKRHKNIHGSKLRLNGDANIISLNKSIQIASERNACKRFMLKVNDIQI